MAKFLARKTLGGFAPVDETGEEYIRKIKLSDTLIVEVKKPRNGRHHRLYWTLMNIVYRNQSHYPSPKAVHNAMKLATGHYEVIVGKSGTEYRLPKSTSFESMDQLEFSEYFERVCDVVASEFLPGVSVAELRSEISQMIGAGS